MDSFRRGLLASELGLDEDNDVFTTSGMMAMRDLMEIAELDNPELHYPPHFPVDHPRLDTPNLFYVIRGSRVNSSAASPTKSFFNLR